MKLIFPLVALLLTITVQTASCSVTSAEKLNPISRFFVFQKRRTCDTNVCFVIDGTTDISPDYFEDQKQLIATVTRSLQKKAGVKRYAAIEYGTSTYVVTPFIDNWKDFIDIIEKAAQTNSRDPYLTGGINYCFSLLERQNSGDKVIVIIGSGRNTIGSNPVRRAQTFVQRGGKIVSVGVGEKQDMPTLKALSGSREEISVTVPHRIRVSARKTADAICK